MHRIVAALAAVLLGWLLLSPATGAVAHPLHTSITEMVHDARLRRVEVVMRVFADDFERALGGVGKGSPDSRAVAGYLARQFVVHGPDGKPIPLRYQGTQRTDDLLWIRLAGDAPAGVRGGRVRNSVALELYADQVNILKVRYATTERTLLFTRRTSSHRLP